MNAPPPMPDTQRPTPGPHYKWAVVGMLWFICFFNYADRQAISAILPLLQKEYGFNKEELGLIGSAFAIVYAVTAPFAGQVGDRFSRKAVILAGLYVWSAITGFTALCSKAWQFVFVRGAEGLGETFYFPASMSLVSDYHTKQTRSRAMSLHQTSVYAGTIGGSVLAGWMGEKYGWRIPFVVLGVAGILLGLVLATFIREPRRNEAEMLENTVEEPALSMSIWRFLEEWVRTPTAVLLALAFFGANSVALVFLVWMPSFLKEKFKLDLALAGFGATFYIQTASMIGASLAGLLADRWRRSHHGGRILTQALGTLCGAPFLFYCGYTRDYRILIGAMTLFGLFKGIYDANIWASLYDVIPPSRRGAAVGLMNFVGWSGGALGVYLVGKAAKQGVTMSAALSSTAVIYLLVTGLLLTAAVLIPRTPESAPLPPA